MLDRNDSRHTVADIRSCEIGVFFFEDIQLTRIGVDHLREDRLEAGQMRAALGVVDVVAESQHIFMEFVDKLEGALDGDLVTDPLEIDDIRDCLFRFVERADKADNSVRLMKRDLFAGILSLVCIQDRELGIEVGRLMHAALDVFLPESCLFKDFRVGQEVDPCTGPLGLSGHGEKSVHQFGHRLPSLIGVLIKKTAASNADGHSFGKGIDYGGSHAVKASARLICVIIKFAAGMQGRKYNSLGTDSLFVHADRDPSAVVFYRAGAVRLKGDTDGAAESGKMLVHRVVHDLIDQVIEAPRGNASYIHSGPCTDRFESLKHLDTVRRILIILVVICHANLLFIISCV